MYKVTNNPVCPNCESENTLPILWGLPIYTEELIEKLENKEVVLGGCVIQGLPPTHRCKDCNHDFYVWA